MMEFDLGYNIRASVLHHVLMSPEAYIVLFEREATGPQTTSYGDLEPTIIADPNCRLGVEA